MWRGNECGKSKMMRISRQPSPKTGYDSSSSAGEYEIFQLFG